jgi:murein DD-endopeptidase MepM/ murein hydrolase activator NlpD
LHRAAVVARVALARVGVNHRTAALAVALLSPLRSIVAPFFGSASELLGGDPARLHPLSGSRKLVEVGADGLVNAAHLDPARIGAAIRSHMVRPDRPERLVPIGVCALLVAAAALSSLPPVGTANGGAAPTHGPRVVIAGLDGNSGTGATNVGTGNGTGVGTTDGSFVAPSPLDTAATGGLAYYEGDVAIPNTLAGPEVGSSGSGVFSTYTVAAGDTLGAIANKFDVSITTLYWANKSGLADPQSLRLGQPLVIPAADGLVIAVAATDTIDSLAAKYKLTPQDLMDANGLAGPNIVTGQTLFIPGANGGAIPTPTPTPKPLPVPAARAGGGGGSTSCSTCGGGTYAGGDFGWPVSGGRNYISQRFSSYHHAIDIAATYGTPVVAAASGVVVFAGWRSYVGGGNVIWISDGSRLYTTYNHLSAWTVQAGQSVSAGQRIGSIGTSGIATGPHLHFEVWTGYPWALGNVSDAVNPCIYLAGC